MTGSPELNLRIARLHLACHFGDDAEIVEAATVLIRTLANELPFGPIELRAEWIKQAIELVVESANYDT
jgi:hypothetical protein